MRGKEIITKLIIPGAIAMIICLIVHPMCMNGEILDWRKLLLFCGNTFRNPENVFVGRSKKCGDRGNAWFGGT